MGLVAVRACEQARRPRSTPSATTGRRVTPTAPKLPGTCRGPDGFRRHAPCRCVGEFFRRGHGRQLEQFAAEGLDRLPRDANWLTTTTLLAEISYALNHGDMAPALYELLAPYGGQCVVIGFAAVCRGSVSTQLGQLATMLGRWDAAERHFSQALVTNQRLGAHSALARTQYLYAHAQLVRSRATDRDGARKLLEETAQVATRLGMAGLVLQVAAALQTLSTTS